MNMNTFPRQYTWLKRLRVKGYVKDLKNLKVKARKG